MESKEGSAGIDQLERGLLLDGGEDEGPTLYAASFFEAEENFVKYQTVRWVLCSCFWYWRGASVRRPVPFPCFGVLKREKHILLPSVADVVIEQGYLQSRFAVYSVRIENIGVRRPPSDDVQIQGVANPHAFREAVLMRLSNMRGEVFSRQVSTVEDVSTPRIGHSAVASMSPSISLRHDSLPHPGEVAILQKLEEVGSSVKRVQTLIQEQNLQTQELPD
ncbi:UNVERIFIED_CONTAM: hypothetical protein Scaly_1994900 [Sesamum calycinum]|uniref:DUF7642 domain-containing protein n=1 Tax=Sesamum calycinum TaxID=2727403 RepID=A0AAW2N2D0_9LAMI